MLEVMPVLVFTKGSEKFSGCDMVLSFQPVERFPPKAQVQIKVKHPRSVLASPARAVLSAMHARLVNLAA